jgi:hypothetical protein
LYAFNVHNISVYIYELFLQFSGAFPQNSGAEKLEIEGLGKSENYVREFIPSENVHAILSNTQNRIESEEMRH